MSEPGMREAILAAQTDATNNTLTGGFLIHRYRDMYPLTDDPNYEPDTADSVESVAKARGITTAEVVYDMLIADRGDGLVLLMINGYAYGSMDALGNARQ